MSSKDLKVKITTNLDEKHLKASNSKEPLHETISKIEPISKRLTKTDSTHREHLMVIYN